MWTCHGGEDRQAGSGSRLKASQRLQRPSCPIDARMIDDLVAAMTDEAPPEFTVITRPRGRAGKGAEWEWGVYPTGTVEPVATGRTIGAERKAKVAGEAAMREILDARPKRSKGSAKPPSTI